jgi:tyrosyl-tRNA synthetase
MKSELLNTLTERGFVHQATNMEGLDQLLTNEQGVKIYIGFDPTAPTLHVGSLIQLMLLRHIKQHGHTPIALLGNGTGMIGDPSGKDESRKVLKETDLSLNAQSIRHKILCPLFGLDFWPKDDGMTVMNGDWLKGLNLLQFLRDIGPHFSVNRMLSFDSVQGRMTDGKTLSFLEFNYMVLQAFDFMHLFETQGVRVQMGGSDQWGNIVNGIELARRKHGVELFGLTTPLLLNSSGQKMGKTAQGAVWLTEEHFSNHDFWQFWRNVDDADVGRFLRLFTDLPLDEIARLEKLEGQELNEAKIVLANSVTTLIRGEKALVPDVPVFSKSTLESQNKKLMAHVVVEAGVFKSVSDAKRNGWDKPIETGDFCLTKRQVRFKVVD